MQLAHSVMHACKLECQHCHAVSRTPSMILARNLHKLVAVQPKLSPIGAKVFIDQLIVERVVARGYRSVRGEEGVRFDDLAGLMKAETGCHQFAAAFQTEEGCVPFVYLPRTRRDPERTYRSYSANTQHNFLGDTHLAITTVKAGREFAVSRSVGSHVGIHQVEGDAPHQQLPDFRINAASGQVNANHDLVAIRADGRHGGRLGEMEFIIGCFLSALAVDALVEVALGIEEADADKGEAKIAGFFTMVAGKNAQAARIDR